MPAPLAHRLPRPRRLAASLAASASLLLLAGSAISSSPAGASNGAADSAGTAATASVDLSQFGVGSPAMVQAELIAVQYWNTSPCSGQVSVAWSTLDPSINATSNWWNPTEAYGNASQNSRCSINFNQVQEFDWPMFCTVMVHEIGHLTGHQHVTDETNVMYPIYVAPIPQCTGPMPGTPATTTTTRKATATVASKRKAASAHKAHSKATKKKKKTGRHTY